MADFPKQLEKWFIDMGYPIEDAKKTDWKIVCKGRLPEYWKEVMRTNIPKQEVLNIKKKMALMEIKNYKEREKTSSALIGNITPPFQIFYIQEKERLRQQLDSLNAKLTASKYKYKLAMDERKRKCYQMHQIKSEIMSNNRQIYVMEEILRKLNADIDKYETTNKNIEKLKNYFTGNSCVNLIEKLNFLRLNEDMALKDFQIDEDLYEDLKNVKPSDLCNFFKIVQKNNSRKVNELISKSQQKYLEKMNSLKKYNTIEEAVIYFKLFHCKLVIETMKLKKELKKIEEITSNVKKNLLKKNNIDNEIFLNKIEKAGRNAYREAVLQEISNLKENRGIYSFLPNYLNIGYSNTQDNINSLKQSHQQLLKKLEDETNNINKSIQRIKENDYKIKHILSERNTNSIDKILWNSDYKHLQQYYLTILLKNPTSFNETANPFMALNCLIKIIADSDLPKKIVDCEGKTLQQILRYQNLIKSSTSLLINRPENLAALQKLENKSNLFCFSNWNMKEYFQSIYCIFYSLVCDMRFRSSLEKFISNEELLSVSDLLGDYCDANYLKNADNKIVLKTSQFLKKSDSFSKIDCIINEVKEICDFFIRFQEMKKSRDRSNDIN